jgi:hypothetical protein
MQCKKGGERVKEGAMQGGKEEGREGEKEGGREEEKEGGRKGGAFVRLKKGLVVWLTRTRACKSLS